MAIKGLNHAIQVVPCHPVWDQTRPDDPEDTHRGWVFTADRPDPFGHKTVREIYEKAQAQFTKPTVPVLFDTKTGTVVNNESADIMR